MKKMVMAVVPHDKAETVLKALIEAGYRATFTESRGGMLRRMQLMLFIAVAQKDCEAVVSIIRNHCGRHLPVSPCPSAEMASDPVSATLPDSGGTAIFVWNLDHFETY